MVSERGCHGWRVDAGSVTSLCGWPPEGASWHRTGSFDRSGKITQSDMDDPAADPPHDMNRRKNDVPVCSASTNVPDFTELHGLLLTVREKTA
jgi:hypothetical protein